MNTTNLNGVGVVHLGVGAFFRAFGLPQLQQMKKKLSPNDVSGWDVVGVSFRSALVRDCLKQNSFRFHAVEVTADGYHLEEIDILRVVYFLQEQRAEVMRVLISPVLKMVTLTISEKGYCYSVETESVDLDHPQIQQDLVSPDVPSSAPGLLVLALKHRRELGLPAFACVSCDNLVENGKVLKKVILDLAQRTDPDLAHWINKNTPFPCTMVDRIVPAATPADIERVSKLTAWADPAPVFHEPFKQWIIEDCFGSLPRPPLEYAGVVFAKDVRCYEEMKLRLLNATHSAIAYTGQLLRKETVSEAVQDPKISGFIKILWEVELCPSLDQPPNVNLSQYTQKLLERYQNSALAHQTMQIAVDGSQKIPSRILAPIRSNLLANRPIRGLSLVVAAWIMFLKKKVVIGKAQDIDDPLRELLVDALRQNNAVTNTLEIGEIFGNDLRHDERFKKSVQQAFKAISQFGLDGCLELYLDAEKVIK